LVPNDLKGKTAAFIVADEFEDLELFHPLYRLQEEGIGTVVIGLTKDPIKGKKGYSITPSASIDEVNAENFEFLVVPGGKSPEKLRLNTYCCHLPRRPSVSLRRDCEEQDANMCCGNKG